MHTTKYLRAEAEAHAYALIQRMWKTQWNDQAMSVPCKETQTKTARTTMYYSTNYYNFEPHYDC